ncbi:MAG: outer membrane protein assembly factor BamB family protein [Symbiobacteriia bacterium]
MQAEHTAKSAHKTWAHQSRAHQTRFSRLRRILALSLTLALLAMAGAVPMAGTSAGTGGPFGLLSFLAPRPALAAGATFTFAHITDAHMGSSQGLANLPKVVQQLLAEPNRPAFVIDSGDLTEFGMAWQYDAYQQATKPLREVGVPVYATPGNHDARWSDAGKLDFRGRFGQPYSSFNEGGVHFVLLDSSVNAETHGHLDKGLLDWLAKDLAAVGTAMPVMVFSHHPIGYTASRFMDNDQDFLDIVRPYNIAALFSGHGHLNLQWNVNGIPAFMTAAAMDAGFKLIEVGGSVAKVYNQVAGGDPQLIATLSLTPPAQRPSVRITTPAAGAVVDSPNTQKLTVQYQLGGFPATVPAPADPPNTVKVQTRLDVGGWQDYTGGIDLTGLPPGFHDLYVQAIDAAGNRAVDRVQIRLTRYLRPAQASAGAPTFSSVPAFRWRFQTGGGIQGQPAVDGSRVYVGSTDGTMYAVDSQYGQPVWSFQTGGAIVSGPTLDSGRLFFGSADGRVYALDAATGHVLWSHPTGGAVVAQPLVHGGLVYVGSADHNLYALSALDGAEFWHVTVGDTIRTRPVYGRGAVYVGAWDKKVYAIDASTGTLRWSRAIARDIYYSPANGAPAYGFGRLFLTTPGDSHAGNVGLWALDPYDGSTLWQSTETTGFSSPSLRAGSLVAGTTDGAALLFDPITGAPQGKAEAGWSNYDSSPVDFGTGGDVVYGSLGGRLIAANPNTGKVLWSYALGDNLIFSTPAVQGGSIYIGSMDGSLYAVAATPSAPLPVITFRDLLGHWSRTDVESLAATHMVNGLPDGTFGVELPLRRSELAALVARYLGLSQPSADFKSQFTDLTGNWSAPYVQALEEKGLLTNFASVTAAGSAGEAQAGADGTTGTAAQAGLAFRPQDPVSRGDAAVLIATALHLTTPSPNFRSKLTDLAGYPYLTFVQALEEQGLVTGYSAGGRIIYNPKGSLTRAQGAALVARMLRY